HCNSQQAPQTPGSRLLRKRRQRAEHTHNDERIALHHAHRARLQPDNVLQVKNAKGEHGSGKNGHARKNTAWTRKERFEQDTFSWLDFPSRCLIQLLRATTATTRNSITGSVAASKGHATEVAGPKRFRAQRLNEALSREC